MFFNLTCDNCNIKSEMGYYQYDNGWYEFSITRTLPNGKEKKTFHVCPGCIKIENKEVLAELIFNYIKEFKGL